MSASEDQTPGAAAAAPPRVADILRSVLARNKWEEECDGKIEQLKKKYIDVVENRSKGAGGSVSSVRRARTRARIIADLLRAAISPAGPALIHGSVALSCILESDRNAIREIVETNDVDYFNVHQVPFVNLDHNMTVRAYQTWRETIISVAIENEMLSASALENGKRGMNKRKESFNRSLLRVRQRLALRSECLTTLRVTMRDKERAKLLYGSDRVVLSVLTYRKMPAEVQAKVNRRNITEQQILDVVFEARKNYESYFASHDGIYHCERRMRTVPASTTFDYFDQTSYFENSVMPLLNEAVARNLSGAEAVNHVFPINADGDFNQCQRAFGYWMLTEFGTQFDLKTSDCKFQNEYKYLIAGHGNDSDIRDLFAELLQKIERVIEKFNAAIAEISDGNENTVTKRATVAAAAAKSMMLPSKSLYQDEDDEDEDDEDEDDEEDVDEGGDSDDEESAVAEKRKRQRKAASDKNIAPSSLPNLLNPAQRRTREQVEKEAEAAAAAGASKKGDLKYPPQKKNPSLWPMPFESDVAPVAPSLSEVPAAADIARRVRLHDALLEKGVLRRTALEVSVGDNLIQTATNATTALVSSASRSNNAAAGIRDVGVDSRRMLNAASMQPIPADAVIQYANPTTGENSASFMNIGDRERAHYWINSFDSDEIPALSDEIRTMSLEPTDTENRISFIRGAGLYHIELGARIVRALQQSRVPARADSETNYAIVNSELTEKACMEFIEKSAASYERMLQWRKTRAPSKRRVKK